MLETASGHSWIENRRDEDMDEESDRFDSDSNTSQQLEPMNVYKRESSEIEDICFIDQLY